MFTPTRARLYAVYLRCETACRAQSLFCKQLTPGAWVIFYHMSVTAQQQSLSNFLRSISLSLHLFSLLLPSLCLYWTHRGHPSLWQQFMQAILYFWITQASVWWRVEARSMFCHCEGKLMHNAQTTWQITTLFSSRLHPWLFWRGKKSDRCVEGKVLRRKKKKDRLVQ